MEFWVRFRRNRLAVVGLVVIFLYISMAVFADFFFTYDFITGNQIPNAFADVGSTAQVEIDGKMHSHIYLFGADNFGRDVFGRIVHGARVSMIIGFVTVFFAVIAGRYPRSGGRILRRAS